MNEQSAVAATTAAPLLYCDEIEVYEDEPVRVIGLTFGIGLLLGIPWVLLTGPYVTQALILDVSQKAGTGHVLLAGAVEVGIGPDGPCSHCGRIVPRMAFCPNYGIATRATPKTGSGRVGRLVR